ncbi:MAG: PIN domain-containing protein [Chloroflexi bacterium]|nr:PIN domain-containing protein [Chloroflexota bacterium]
MTTITEMELLIGASNKTEQRGIECFLKRFQIIRFNPRISDLVANLIRQCRLRHGLLIADAFIAAAAIISGVPLSSRNQRDFRFILQLTLLPYL